MNSTKDIWSVAEVRAVLIEINNCENEVDVTFVTGEQGKNPCTMEQLCDSCVDKFAAMLEWAEDEDKPSQSN